MFITAFKQLATCHVYRELGTISPRSPNIHLEDLF